MRWPQGSKSKSLSVISLPMSLIKSFITAKGDCLYSLLLPLSLISGGPGVLVAQQGIQWEDAGYNGIEFKEKNIATLRNPKSPRMWRLVNKNSSKDAKVTFYLSELTSFTGTTATYKVNKERITLEIPAKGFADFNVPPDAPNGFKVTSIILKPAQPPDPSQGRTSRLAESQEWTNAAGQKITAAVNKVENGQVHFVMPNGSVVQYEFSKLSPETIAKLKVLVDNQKAKK